MFDKREVLQMLVSLDPNQLAKLLRHLRHAAKDALDGKGDRFRLDDLVPIADAFAFVSEEMDWSLVRELDPETWAKRRGGAR